MELVVVVVIVVGPLSHVLDPDPPQPGVGERIGVPRAIAHGTPEVRVQGRLAGSRAAELPDEALPPQKAAVLEARVVPEPKFSDS